MERRVAVIAVAALGLLALAASVEMGLLPVGGGGSARVCSTCFSQEPVVDVIMPALGASGNFSSDRVINMTAGETRTFEVDVYPTIPLTCTMSLGTVLAPDAASQAPGSGVGATFAPTSLTVATNGRGTTLMTLSVAQSAARGTYDMVVTATDASNSSEVWGLYFEISVG